MKVGGLRDTEITISENVESYPTFGSMGLKNELLKGIHAYGFQKPSLIQQKSIKQIIDGRDVIAQAQSGTGKTATFCIGTLQNVRTEFSHVQLLILAPTRELALQIYQVISSLSDYMSIKCIACCGGRSNSGQMARELSKGGQVVVGTPGRILELIRLGSLRLNKLEALVLDEADEMLNQGLRIQLEQLFGYLPSRDGLPNIHAVNCQVIIISATMPKEHLDIFQNLAHNPVSILVPRDELTLDVLKQFYIDVTSEEWKFEALSDLFTSVCVSQTVIFVNTRRKVDWLNDQLTRAGFTVTSAHGEMDQIQRECVMEKFRSGKSRILVSSDVWARGIDVQTVSLVVNYDIPMNSSDYLHRIGRSGRFGRKGLAVTFIAGAVERKQLTDIANFYHISIPPAPARLEKMLIAGDTAEFDEKQPVVSAVALHKATKKHKTKKKRHKRRKKV